VHVYGAQIINNVIANMLLQNFIVELKGYKIILYNIHASSSYFDKARYNCHIVSKSPLWCLILLCCRHHEKQIMFTCYMLSPLD
jgi:hypothetical protein